MSNKYGKLLKNLGILTISNFSSKILVFLLVPIYTGALSKSEYGIYDLASTTVLLLYPILTLNVIDAVMRFTMDKKYEKVAVVTLGLKYIGFGVIIGAGICWILPYVSLFREMKGLEIFVFLYYVFYLFNQFFIQLSKGLEKVRQMGIAAVMSTAIMLITNILFLLVFDFGLKGFFVANILAQMIPVIYFAISLKVWEYIKFNKNDKTLEKEMLIYCTPLIFTVVGWWVNSASDRYVVTGMMGVAANGLLSVSYKIPSVINTIQGIFVQAWQISAITEYGSDESKKFYTNSFMYLNMVMVIAASVLIFMTRPIANILYANEFYEAWKYVPYLIISGVVNAAAGFYGSILSAKKNTSVMAKAAIYGAVVNLILNFILVYFIGIQGATIATLISSLIIYFVRSYAAREDVERNKWIILSWIVLILQATVEIYIEKYLLEAVLVVVICALYSKPIIKVIKERKMR